VDLARPRRRPAAVQLRPGAPVRRRSAPRARRRRRVRLRRRSARLGHRHLCGLRALVRDVPDDRDLRRLLRHAHPSRLARGGAGLGSCRGGHRRHDRAERRPRGDPALRPPRRARHSAGSGLRGPGVASAGARRRRTCPGARARAADARGSARGTDPHRCGANRRCDATQRRSVPRGTVSRGTVCRADGPADPRDGSRGRSCSRASAGGCSGVAEHTRGCSTCAGSSGDGRRFHARSSERPDGAPAGSRAVTPAAASRTTGGASGVGSLNRYRPGAGARGIGPAARCACGEPGGRTAANGHAPKCADAGAPSAEPCRSPRAGSRSPAGPASASNACDADTPCSAPPRGHRRRRCSRRAPRRRRRLRPKKGRAYHGRRCGST
jgi:hypothetical protein